MTNWQVLRCSLYQAFYQNRKSIEYAQRQKNQSAVRHYKRIEKRLCRELEAIDKAAHSVSEVR